MRSIMLLVLSALLLLPVACQKNERPTMTGREKMNREKLEGAPSTVRDGFMRDFPNATVTSVQRFDRRDGPAVYEIRFVRDQQTQSATYTADGRQVSPPPHKP